jgi:endonuclease/exonuclease/phosphatase family metal-dependent hydrolase
LKIVQVNIWQGKFGQQIIDFLQAEKPDFVCMQEVNDLPGRSGYSFFATLDEIKQGAAFNHAFMSATYSSRYMERELDYGNAILSRLTPAAEETIFTNGQYIKNFDMMQSKGEGNNRNLQHMTVQLNGRSLHILNHHGYWVYGSKAGNDETLRQMKIIADVIDSLDGPIILCGDFNLSPDSQSLNLINQRLTNLSAKHGLKNTYSQFSTREAVCDHIFVNDQVKVERFEMSEVLISDHKALILDFEI